MALPTGPAVTFLFTDVEGSTRLERAVGSAAWANLVARHDGVVRAAIEGASGVVAKTEGDSFFAAFARPADALTAAVAAQRAIAGEPWADGATPRVRMGLHLGKGRLRHFQAAGDTEDYVGIDVNYTARIAAAGNGGQIVLSHALIEALGESAPGAGVEVVDEGLRAVKDFDEPKRLHRLIVAGAADDARSLRIVANQFPPGLPHRYVLLSPGGTGVALPLGPDPCDQPERVRDVLSGQHPGAHRAGGRHLPVLDPRRRGWSGRLADRDRRPRGKYRHLAAPAGLIALARLSWRRGPAACVP